MKKPKVGDIWKDTWLNLDGSIKYEDIFIIVKVDLDNPVSQHSRVFDEKGFMRKYLVTNSGCTVGETAWKYNTSLNSFKYRITTPIYGYNTPLWKTINCEDSNEIKN